MPQLYKAMTAVLAFTGCISLFISGALNPFMFIAGIGLIPGYYRLWKGMPHASKWTIGGLSIAALFFSIFDALAITGDVFIAVAHLTIVFHAIKSFDLKEPWDHLQVYFMALLQLIIASELTRSIAFGVVFVLFLVALVTAMVLSHFLKEGTLQRVRFKRPVVVISLITLLATTLFFISAPRIKGGLLGRSLAKGIKTVGFSEKVDFGSFGNIKLDPTIVMRVELSGRAELPFYWRGLTLNYFDSKSWQDTLEDKYEIQKKGERFLLRPFPMDKAIIQRIFLEPIESEVIFGLSNVTAVEIESRTLLVDDAGALFIPRKSSMRMSYTVYSIFEEQVAEGDLLRYLQLSPDAGRISRLAEDITKGIRTDMEKAVGIEGYLKTNYKYSLITSSPPEGVSPIEDFLFNSKKGYCEHYATSMVLMLRAIGIPARIVTGFVGGEENKYGGYIIVRQSNAHSWVEAVIDGRWKRFDPTPPAASVVMPSLLAMYLDTLRLKWYRYVIGFSSIDQRRLIEFISMPFVRMPQMPEVKVHGIEPALYIIIFVAITVLVVFIIKRLGHKRYDFVTANYLKLRGALKNRGAMITASSTPSDVAREAMRLGIDGKAAEFIRLYEEARFGGKKMDKEDVEMYRHLLREMTKTSE